MKVPINKTRFGSNTLKITSFKWRPLLMLWSKKHQRYGIGYGSVTFTFKYNPNGWKE